MNEQQIVEALQDLDFFEWGEPGISSDLHSGAKIWPLLPSAHLRHKNLGKGGSVYVATPENAAGPGVLVATGQDYAEELSRRRPPNGTVTARRNGAKPYPAWVDLPGDAAASDLIAALKSHPV